MTALVYLLVGTLMGYGSHQARHITRRFTGAWERIANYAVGVSLNLPLGLAIYVRTPDDRRDSGWRFAIAYLLSFGAFGAGVVAGWIADEIKTPGQ